MFKPNDILVYGTQGVCKIIRIEERDFMGAKRKYLVLKPVNYDSNTTLFIPMDNKTLLKKMRSVLSEEEINALIDSMPDREARWIANDNRRKETYKKILAGGSHVELIKMIKTIYIQKMNRESDGKRLHISDEHFLKEAEQLLYNEFQYSLRIDREQLISYILARIEGNQKHP